MTDLATRPAAPSAVAVRAAALAEYERLLDATARALSDAVPERTARARHDDRLAYAEWCVGNGRGPWPATADQLTAYTLHLTTAPRPARPGRAPDVRPYGPATIERRLSSVRTAHAELGMPTPDTRDAWRLLRAYRRRLALEKSEQGRTRKASPALPGELRLMLATLDRGTLAGARDAALLLVGYACAARISELVALDAAEAVETADGLLVTLYRKKIQRHTESAVPYASDPDMCPVRAVRALRVLLAAEGRTTGPLFVRVDRHGRIGEPMFRHGRPIGDAAGRITPRAAADVIARCADLAGLTGQWSGHSLRRGFATAARRRGADLEVIGRHGGWADGSKALLGYIEDADRWSNNPVAYE